MLALARRFAGKDWTTHLRFVAFVNEEPPYFLSDEMGSFVYAGRCKARGDKISAHDQSRNDRIFFRCAAFADLSVARTGLFYPKVGNFIGFVGNVRSRSLLRRVIATLSQTRKDSIRRRGASVLHSRRQLVGPMVILAARLSRHHGHRHRAVSLSALSFSKRHA